MEVVGMFVLKGQTTLKIRYDTHLMQEAAAEPVFLGQHRPGPRPASAAGGRLPSWARRMRRSPPRRCSRPSFFDSRINDKAPLEEAFTDAAKVKDPKSLLRVVAVFGLAAVNDLPRWWTPWATAIPRRAVAAISAMRHWGALKPDNDAKLYKATEPSTARSGRDRDAVAHVRRSRARRSLTYDAPSPTRSMTRWRSANSLLASRGARTGCQDQLRPGRSAGPPMPQCRSGRRSSRTEAAAGMKAGATPSDAQK